MSRRSLLSRLYLTLTALEGLLAVISIFATPSEPDSAWLLGYSKTRIAIGALGFLAALPWSGAAFFAWLRPLRFDTVVQRVFVWLAGKNHLLAMTLVLGCGILLAAWGTLFTWLFIPAVLRGLIVWAGLACAQGLIFLRWQGGDLFARERIPARLFDFPRWRSLDRTQRRILALLALIGVLYFAGFVFPNAQFAENEHELLVHGVDEPVMYPILMQMFVRGETPQQSMYYFFIYEDYHYGFPFYFLSVLVLLPVQLLGGGAVREFTQINMLLLRQFISVLPVILTAGVLVYLQTRFRSWWKSLALFGLLLVIPEVFNYNIRFWHPDGLTALCAALTLFFLDRDRLRFGTNFYAAAIFCGLASALRLYGFFFVLTIPAYLAAGFIQKRITLRGLVGRAIGFVALMLAVFLLTSPYLFLGSARERAVEIMLGKTTEFSQGYEGMADPEGVFQTGLDAWLPRLAYPYAPPVYLGFLLISLLAACAWGSQKFANRLILTWVLPISVYLIWFVVVKSPHYWLPVMLPLYSAALGLTGLVEGESTPPKLRVAVNVGVGLVIAALAVVSVRLIQQYFL